MQILLDQDRFERLEAEARRRSQSVGATVREAIDLLLQTEAGGRMAARRSLLAQPTATAPEPGFDKDALLDAGSG